MGEQERFENAKGIWCSWCQLPWEVRIVAPPGGCLLTACRHCGRDYQLAATTLEPGSVHPAADLLVPPQAREAARDITALNMRSIAADQRKHGGKMGPQLAELIEAWSDQRATLLAEKAAAEQSAETFRKAAELNREAWAAAERARDEARVAEARKKHSHKEAALIERVRAAEADLPAARLRSDEWREERDRLTSQLVDWRCWASVESDMEGDDDVLRSAISEHIASLTDEVDGARDARTTLTAQLEEARKELDDTQAVVLELRDQIDEANTENLAEAAESQLAALRVAATMVQTVAESMGESLDPSTWLSSTEWHTALDAIDSALSVSPVPPQTKEGA